MKTSVEHSDKLQAVRYNDLPIRIFLAVIAAHIMTIYNEQDSFFEALFTISYLRGFIASFVMAYVVLWYIYYITTRLDRRYDWHSQTLIRFILQACIGFIAPAIIAFLLVALFLSIYDINILNTVYLKQDYPLVLLMLLAANLYYFGLYSFLIARPVIAVSSEEAGQQEPPADHVYRETIIITTTLKIFPVNTDDIAYIFRMGDGVFIRLRDMKDIKESYRANYSLKDLEALLDPSKFFRINRQMTVHFQSVVSFRQETSKTLLLTLDPEMYPVHADIPPEHIKLTVVSENRTPKFKLWMKR